MIYDSKALCTPFLHPAGSPILTSSFSLLILKIMQFFLNQNAGLVAWTRNSKKLDGSCLDTTTRYKPMNLFKEIRQNCWSQRMSRRQESKPVAARSRLWPTRS